MRYLGPGPARRLGSGGNGVTELLAHAAWLARQHARTNYAEALTLLGDVDSPAEKARALEGTGRCHLSTGEIAAAALSLRQARDIYARLGTPRTDQMADQIDLLLREPRSGILLASWEER